MKLYDINQSLESLLIQLEPDPETGEIPSNEDEIIAQINALALEREEILQYLAKLALNIGSDVAALAEEEKRLKERRQRLDRRHSNLIAILDRECGGQKTDLGVATLFYRRSSRVEITDSAAALSWLESHDREDCISRKPPEISKSSVGRLLDSGVEIPGAEKVHSVSCYLK